jgi:hypothetical protein
MQPDQAAGVGQGLGNILEPERGSVGGKHGARLYFFFQLLEEALLDVELLHDRLDDHVGMLDMLAGGIGDEPR